MRVYSFDVFDTLLTRPLLRPADLFFQVGRLCANEAHGGFTPSHYACARQQAQRRARAAGHPREECAFVDIFRHFPELSHWGLSVQTAMTTEIAAERAAMRAITVNRVRVRSLLAAGETVVFLSDMYLPTTVIHGFLNEHVAPCARDQVFVSGDLGVAKYSGRLYTHVLEQLGITPAQLSHVGDHAYADVQVPRRLGIAAEHYPQSAPNRFERLPRPRRRAPLWRSAAGGISRAARLATTGERTWAPEVAGIACGVIAPVLCAYVAWVLEDAHERGLERLYFVSRDGQILHKIAAAMRTADAPECRYLYGSRQAWLLPSVIAVNRESLAWTHASGLSRTGDGLLRRIECDTPAVRTLLREQGFAAEMLARQLTDSEFERICSLLTAHPLADLIRERAGERRAVVQDYLRQEGLLDGTRWALVDVGWELRCQRALRQILVDAGFRQEVNGYYLGLSRNHVALSECGPCQAFVTQTGCRVPGQLQADWLLKRASITLVEHLFAVADHPSVAGYRHVGERVEPRFQDADEDPEVIALCRTLHDGVLRYVRELGACPFVAAGDAPFRERAMVVMRAFCMAPDVSDARAVAWLPVNMDHTHAPGYHRTLARPLNITDLWRMFSTAAPTQAAARTGQDLNWLAGSAALSSLAVRVLYGLWYRWQRLVAGGGG